MASTILGTLMKHKHFGQWLKAKLKFHKIKQQELATQICVAENTVTSWCTNTREPTIRNFKWICKYFAVIEIENNQYNTEEDIKPDVEHSKEYTALITEGMEYF